MRCGLAKSFLMFRLNGNNLKILVVGLCAFLGAAVSSLHAAQILINWEGAISMVTAYGDSTLPAGVGNSVAISGSVLFDTAGYLGSSDLEYSNGSGTSYSYSDQIMSNTVRIGGLEWQMNGGQLSLFQESPEDKKTIAVASTSVSDSFDLFPDFAGSFEFRMGFIEEGLPLTLFGTDDLANTALDFSQVTSAAGVLTSRAYSGSTIVSGYFLYFDVTQVSAASVPEPSTWMLMGFSGVAVLCCLRGRHLRRWSRRCHLSSAS